MEKPFVLLGKETADSVEIIAPSTPGDDCSQTSYCVKAIIRKKLLFNNRPKPIIAHVPKKV